MLILAVAPPPTRLAAAPSIFSDKKPHALSGRLEIDGARSPGLCFSGASVLLRPWVLGPFWPKVALSSSEEPSA